MINEYKNKILGIKPITLMIMFSKPQNKLQKLFKYIAYPIIGITIISIMILIIFHYNSAFYISILFFFYFSIDTFYDLLKKNNTNEQKYFYLKYNFNLLVISVGIISKIVIFIYKYIENIKDINIIIGSSFLFLVLIYLSLYIFPMILDFIIKIIFIIILSLPNEWINKND